MGRRTGEGDVDGVDGLLTHHDDYVYLLYNAHNVYKTPKSSHT